MAESQQKAEEKAVQKAQSVLGAGSFYGTIQAKREKCEAIFTDVRHASPRRLPAHAHELPFFELILDGQYEERFGRQAAQFSPFTMLFRPAGVPHQDEIGPRGVLLFEIEVRTGWQKRLADCSGFLDQGCNDCFGGKLLWLGMKMHRDLHAGVADELLVESLLSEMLATVARMPRESWRDQPAWVVRVADKLAAEYAGKITLDELSREAGVHPVHLSRVFRKWKGAGIGEYMHRLRIRAACEQMLSPEIPIAEISLATGFSDQSHFTRSFRRLTGMTPAVFRSQLKSAFRYSADASPMIARVADNYFPNMG
jgi:AraC family transcriptional regulator